MGPPGRISKRTLRKENATLPNNAYSDVTTDAEQILATTSANPDLQQIVQKHRPQIQEVLGEIKALKVLQKTLTADKQKATQDLQGALKRLKELLIFLRAAIRGDIGPRTEKLVAYGMTPLRKRRGSKAKPTGEGESAKQRSTAEPEKSA